MKNEYEIRGDVTAIFISSPKYGKFETLISTSSLDRVKEHPNSWRVVYQITNRSFYCVSTTYEYRKQIIVQLSRWVTNAPPKGMVVDHVNHNTLDNTDINLRVVTPAENQQNRFARIDCRSGVRGVSWDKHKKRWRGIVQSNGKKVHAGYFRTIEECEISVKSKRKELMPFSTDYERVKGLNGCSL